jgi:hypothetical protein
VNGVYISVGNLKDGAARAENNRKKMWISRKMGPNLSGFLRGYPGGI